MRTHEGDTMTGQANAVQRAAGMAEEWTFKGNNASDKGDHDKAERHYQKAQVWMDRMNVLLGNGDGCQGLRSRIEVGK